MQMEEYKMTESVSKTAMDFAFSPDFFSRLYAEVLYVVQGGIQQAWEMWIKAVMCYWMRNSGKNFFLGKKKEAA